jgi:hypothetical protein
MLAALAVTYAQENLQAGLQEKTRSAHVVNPLRKKVKEGSDDRRIKSAGPARPAVGGRQRFSQAHGSELIEPSIVASEDAGSHKRAKVRACETTAVEMCCEK